MSTVNQLMRELQDSRLRVEQLLASNARVTTEIEELRAGACRFHCRTAKENYMEGWLQALTHVDAAIGWHPEEREEAWRANTASK